MVADICVFDVGSTYTKVAAFSFQERQLIFLGRGQAPTTLESVLDGVEAAKAQLNQQEIQMTEDTKYYSSCSAAGGLRMVALGYMPQVTAKAAKEVAMTAGARVMEVISIEEPRSYRKEVLQEIRPDIILLAGGTDGGDESSALENADIICEVGTKAVVIIACNKYVQRAVAEKFKVAQISYIRVANIMPTIHELKVKAAREAIHEQFIYQITRAKGVKSFCDMLENKMVIPTPGAVLLASELFAKGTYEQEGLGSLILVDVGGATTDIHSAVVELEDLKLEEKGLIVNNEKQFSYRTVEGNLGMRVSATGILDAVGASTLQRMLDDSFQMSEEDLFEYVEDLEIDPTHIPQDEKENSVDRAMATCAVHLALKRHAGIYAKENDAVMGIMAGAAMGRDLRYVKQILCVGGIFRHSTEEEKIKIVEKALEDTGNSLLPMQRPKFLFDTAYILFALGVLGNDYPNEVLAFMKQYFVEPYFMEQVDTGNNL